MTTPVNVWGPAFSEFAPQHGDDINLKATPKFSIKWLSNPTNIFSTFSSGNWCRLCQTHGILDREQHLAEHMAELEVFLTERKATAQAVKEEIPEKTYDEEIVVQAKPVREAPFGYYTNPCVVCGNPIPKTGKRGQPPKKCPDCR